MRMYTEIIADMKADLSSAVTGDLALEIAPIEAGDSVMTGKILPAAEVSAKTSGTGTATPTAYAQYIISIPVSYVSESGSPCSVPVCVAPAAVPSAPQITHITQEQIDVYRKELVLDQKAPATIEKYVHAVTRFVGFLDGAELSKERLIAFQDSLSQDGLRPQTVNGFLTAVHGFLAFLGRKDLRVLPLKVQHCPFRDEVRQLTREEYMLLLKAARGQGNERLALVLETICATGIRVSELRFFTVEALKAGHIEISLKGKNRTILMPKELKRVLLSYASVKGIHSGPVFITKSGSPLNRSNIAHEMKKLAEAAGVDAQKIFPHNLRHLFAREFFSRCTNIALLADVMGHSRIETTRIYIATTAEDHEKILDDLQLVS